MGLVLAVREGERVYLNDDWVRVVRVTAPEQFVVENEDGTAFTIEDDREHEVIPEVRISAAYDRGFHGGEDLARLYITAPRDMRILREKAWRNLRLVQSAREVIFDLSGEVAKLAGSEEDASGLLDRAEEVLEDLDEAIERNTRGGRR